MVPAGSGIDAAAALLFLILVEYLTDLVYDIYLFYLFLDI